MGKTLNSESLMINTISNTPLGTGILAFRDLETELKKNICGKKALDFGCGAGRSSRLLDCLGYNVTAVDISEKMLKIAKSKGGSIEYKLIKSTEMEQEFGFDNIFDLILVSFVTMEIATIDKMVDIFSNLKKCLSKNGKIVAICSSDYLYTGSWLSLGTDYPANKLANSGDIVKIYLKDYGFEISDYFWKEKDCENVFKLSGLILKKKIYPLGKIEDNKLWVDETKKPPFVIYFLGSKG